MSAPPSDYWLEISGPLRCPACDAIASRYEVGDAGCPACGVPCRLPSALVDDARAIIAGVEDGTLHIQAIANHQAYLIESPDVFAGWYLLQAEGGWRFTVSFRESRWHELRRCVPPGEWKVRGFDALDAPWALQSHQPAAPEPWLAAIRAFNRAVLAKEDRPAPPEPPDDRPRYWVSLDRALRCPACAESREIEPDPMPHRCSACEASLRPPDAYRHDTKALFAAIGRGEQAVVASSAEQGHTTFEAGGWRFTAQILDGEWLGLERAKPPGGSWRTHEYSGPKGDAVLPWLEAWRRLGPT